MKPTGVQIHRRNGTTLHAELIHLGENEAGVDIWQITGITYQPGDRITVDNMPPLTGIEFRISEKCRGPDDINWHAT